MLTLPKNSNTKRLEAISHAVHRKLVGKIVPHRQLENTVIDVTHCRVSVVGFSFLRKSIIYIQVNKMLFRLSTKKSNNTLSAETRILWNAVNYIQMRLKPTRGYLHSFIVLSIVHKLETGLISKYTYRMVAVPLKIPGERLL